MGEQQVTVRKPLDASGPANKIANAWKRIRSIVIRSGDTDACLTDGESFFLSGRGTEGGYRDDSEDQSRQQPRVCTRPDRETGLHGSPFAVIASDCL